VLFKVDAFSRAVFSWTSTRVSLLSISPVQVTKLAKEKADIAEILSTLDVESSNLKTYFREGITISTQLAISWTSSPIPLKEKLQKFIFPEGVTYNREKGEHFVRLAEQARRAAINTKPRR
jgi:hypothetical protein